MPLGRRGASVLGVISVSEQRTAAGQPGSPPPLTLAALRFGFTKAELAEQLANFTTGYENAVRGQETRSNDQLADQIMAMAEVHSRM